jgi:GDPmannose 4,6-dehydratase
VANKPVSQYVVEKDLFNVKFMKTRVDALMLKGELKYILEDEGIRIKTDKDNVMVVSDEDRFRPADVSILMSNTRKIQRLEFKVTKSLEDIIRDQVNYYSNPENRKL